MRIAMLLWVLLLASPLQLSAQHDTLRASEYKTPHDGGALVLAGVGGMVVGALGGGLIGVGIDEDSGLDAAEGAVIGGLIGTTLAIPTAVHLANGRRGNLGRSMLVSTLVGGTLFGIGWAAESGEFVLAAPVGQIITAIWIERRTD